MKNILLIILLMVSSACWAQTTSTSKPDTDTKVYTIVDEMPQFPGGDSALNQFLTKTIQYPAEAKTQQLEGIVYLSFIVNKDGTLSNIKIMHDIGDGCGAEAERAVKLMPKWIPGKLNGTPVNVQYDLPVDFPLSSE